jgi:hypothetical protein
MQQRGFPGFEHRRADVDLGDAKGRATLHLVKRVPLPPCNARGPSICGPPLPGAENR